MLRIRKGFVSSYDETKYTARICFPDDNNVVSDNLSILEGCTLPLRVDEFVMCVYDAADDGYILGRLHKKVT